MVHINLGLQIAVQVLGALVFHTYRPICRSGLLEQRSSGYTSTRNLQVNPMSMGLASNRFSHFCQTIRIPKHKQNFVPDLPFARRHLDVVT